MTLRPSLLPKLAACPRYQSPADAGPAAERGTVLDAAFRKLLGASDAPYIRPLDSDESSSVQWAVDTARLLAGGFALEAREEHLRVEVMGMAGTADLLCSGKLWSADLKTGQVRDYTFQQMAYALGFMDDHFCDSWTVHLLFCDERKLKTYQFTRTECESALRVLLASVKDELSSPTPCDYCDWCALRWVCPQKLETVAWFLRHDPASIDLTAYSNDPAKVGPLLDMTHAIAKDDGVHDLLKAGALSSILAGHEVTGWKVANGRKTESAAVIQLSQLVEKLGPQRVLAMLGNVSGSKFRELWKEAKGNEPIPDGIIQTNHGAAFLQKAKAKQTK